MASRLSLAGGGGGAGVGCNSPRDIGGSDRGVGKVDRGAEVEAKQSQKAVLAGGSRGHFCGKGELGLIGAIYFQVRIRWGDHDHRS